MEVDEFTSKLEKSRADFLEVINKIPQDKLELPGVIENWSVKDILVHLTRWEAEIIKLIWQVGRGLQPTTAHFDQFSVDETNECWYQESRTRPMNIVMSDFLGVRVQTIRRVKELSLVDLTDATRFSWLDGKALWEWIADDSIDHESEHGDQIESWMIAEGLG